MLVLGIRYLNGWAMAAADGAKKERAEWPPHPDRVFMALAAAWFETTQEPTEEAALRWLESLEPPAIRASDAEFRHGVNDNRPTVSYVPVNDSERTRKLPNTASLSKLKEAGLALLPEHRQRQPRRFPMAIPYDPVVFFLWDNVDAKTHRHALEGLLRKVTHIGHPASLVQMWIDDSEVETNLVPVEGQAIHRLRVFSAGRLDYLEDQYNRKNRAAYADLIRLVKDAKGKAKTKLQAEIYDRFRSGRPVTLRPEPGRWQGYDRPIKAVDTDIPGTVFDSRLTILSLSGKTHSLQSTLKLTDALRREVLAACPDPIPEWVSGQGSDGKPSKKPHLAIVPLPFVDHEHADGRLIGLAFAIPRAIEVIERRRCLNRLFHDEFGLSRRTKLFNGEWFECSIEMETRETPPASLQTELWTQSSRIWASVTPVGLDRHFDGDEKWERAAESIKDSCERIGLPRPKEVILNPVSLLEGVPHVREFPYLVRRTDGGRIHHSHAIINFDKEIVGPVIVGAGRYKGYGLCRPIRGILHG